MDLSDKGVQRRECHTQEHSDDARMHGSQAGRKANGSNAKQCDHVRVGSRSQYAASAFDNA